MADHPHRSKLSPRRRAAVLLAALLLTVLQVAALSHVVSHAATGDTSGCEICLNAANGGNALVAASPVQPVIGARVGRLTAVAERPVYSRTPTVFRARGPPSFA